MNNDRLEDKYPDLTTAEFAACVAMAIPHRLPRLKQSVVEEAFSLIREVFIPEPKYAAAAERAIEALSAAMECREGVDK